MRESSSEVPRKRILVVFDFIGPYHAARLRSISPNFELVALECSTVSRDTNWLNSCESNVQKRTLVSKGDVTQFGFAELKSRVKQALTELKPDVVVVAGWADRVSLSVLKWSFANRVPAVVMSESQSDDCRRNSITEWVKSKILESCSTGLVGGQTHRAYLESLGMPSDSIFLGYDAVDNDYFTRCVDEIRSSNIDFGVTHELPKKFFLATCRFIEKKNLIRLLEAYAEYAKSSVDSPWHLVLLGEGDLRATIECKIAELQLSSMVHLPGFAQYSQIPKYYAAASALIHASTVEQWGLVVNEAMASRLPVLVSERCGSARELIQPNINGLIFNPLDVGAISDSMIQMASMSEYERKKIAEEGHRTIQAWGPRRFQQGLEDACGKAIQKGPSHGGMLSRFLLSLYSRISN